MNFERVAALIQTHVGDASDGLELRDAQSASIDFEVSDV